MTSAETIAALFGAIIALNVHLLIATLTSIPALLDRLSLGPLYVFCLQLLVAVCLVRLLCILLDRSFNIYSIKVQGLIFLYAVFPIPILVVWVRRKLLILSDG